MRTFMAICLVAAYGTAKDYLGIETPEVTGAFKEAFYSLIILGVVALVILQDIAEIMRDKQ